MKPWLLHPGGGEIYVFLFLRQQDFGYPDSFSKCFEGNQIHSGYNFRDAYTGIKFPSFAQPEAMHMLISNSS